MFVRVDQPHTARHAGPIAAPDDCQRLAQAHGLEGAGAPPAASFPTRTYTVEQLERRRAWGAEYGKVGAAYKRARQKREG